MSDRLTNADWVDHGLRTLAQAGPNALKIGQMAAGLNVSRGSFYWHFRDIADFRTQLLESWRERTTERIIRDIDAQQAEPDRLGSLMTGAFIVKPAMDRATSPWAAEDAIRAWAATDVDIAAIVASVDDRRVAYIAELLAAAGVDRATANDRAAFLYWAYLGQAIIMAPRHASATPAAVEDICRLVTR
jgi:AcrR family transcriptional regulator